MNTKTEKIIKRVVIVLVSIAAVLMITAYALVLRFRYMMSNVPNGENLVACIELESQCAIWLKMSPQLRQGLERWGEVCAEYGIKEVNNIESDCDALAYYARTGERVDKAPSKKD